MERLTTIAKALSDTSRVRVLLALEGKELCACQIIELLALAPSTVSKHMSILREAGLVTSRKDGRWMHFRLVSGAAPPHVKRAIKWAYNELKDDPVVKKDRARLKKIIKRFPEESCRT